MANILDIIQSRLQNIEALLLDRHTQPLPRVLKFNDACKYTGLTASYMYKLTSAGVIPYSKPNGKTIFFDREKLDEWLLSNSTTSAKEKDIQADTYLTTKK